ncbi:MAG: TetR/AcrR family transcriptional regulator [Pseudomonadales bacterium]|nr:TetR/AcrR family transcriptional regulator [Pseudomonadales bacterium]
MPKSTTAERILDAAQILFAIKGFAGTSLRHITSKAGVNLAAVNYHFGSKEKLMRAVFERTLTPFCDSLEKQLLSHGQSGGEPLTLEELFEIMVSTANNVYGDDSKEFSRFMRLMGLAYAQTQDELRGFLGARYGMVFRRFLVHVKLAAPEMPPKELFWRIHFALGAAVFTLASFGGLQEVLLNDYKMDVGLSDVVTRLVPFMAAGIRGEVEVE